MTVRRSLGVLLAACATLAAGRGDAAYPEKPITYVIPFPAGGESDVAARIQAKLCKARFGQDMVLVNKAGSGGAVSWSQLNKQAPDGYTIMGVNLPHILLQPLEPNAPYQTDDITPVYFFHYTPDVIVVPNDSPYRTYQDLVADAKANPGKVSFGGSSKFSANHMAHERFRRTTGVSTTYVPFGGSGEIIAALQAHQVTAAMTFTTFAVQNKDKVRVLAVASEARSPHFPGVPTFKEVGLGWAGGAYRGIAVPKATPPAVRKDVSDLIAALNKDPEVTRSMAQLGFEPIDIPLARVPAFMAEKARQAMEDARAVGLAK